MYCEDQPYIQAELKCEEYRPKQKTAFFLTFFCLLFWCCKTFTLAGMTLVRGDNYDNFEELAYTVICILSPSNWSRTKQTHKEETEQLNDKQLRTELVYKLN